MPNWASCSATFTGDKEAIDKIVATPFSADRWAPMPEALASVSTGSRKIGDKVVNKWRDNPDGTATIITELEEASLIAAYGAADWYQWASMNYGCKWAPSSIGEWQRVSDTEARVTFDTPWAPPVALFRTISEQEEDVEITLRYCEGGSDYWGIESFLNGWSSEVDGGAMSDYFDNHTTSEGCPDWNPEEMYCECSYYDTARGPLASFFETYGMHSGG